MAYERINWQNGEVGNTPLNANNLNRMDMAIEEHDQKIGDHDYEIENLKTGEQGITEELNKKMDRINPQGSGTLSIPAVNADNITAQTVEADEIKVTKVGSKGGTAPVVFDNDILVNGITTPIGSLASSASAKAESAERIANEADREAGTARTIASTAYSRVQENIFRTDKLEGIVGGGVGESIPQYTYYNGKYLRPDGEIANYNDSARVIEFEINKNSDSGCNVIFKNVDLIPTDASILCGFYNAAGILLGEEMRGLIIMADFDEDTGKMTRQYISYCVVPAPYYAKYVRISGIANGAVDIAVQTTLSDAVAELQSRSTSALVLTNPSPLPATDGKNILGIDAKGNSKQNGEVAFNKSTVVSGERLTADNGVTYGTSADFYGDANHYTSALMEVSANGTYTRFSSSEDYHNRTAFYNANKVRVGKSEAKTFTVTSDTKYIAVCGYISELNSMVITQTPTPTSPILIVDASEDVTAHTINILNPIWEKGNALNLADTMNARLKNTNLIHIQKGKTYTINIFDSAYQFAMVVSYVSTSYPFDSSKMFDSGFKTSAYSYTATADGVMCITLKHSDGSNVSVTEEVKVAVVEGTSLTEFIPYASNTITLPFSPKSVGSVANEFIINEDGTGKIAQRVDSKEFNGTENWTTRTTASGWKLYELDNAFSGASTSHPSGSALVASNQYSANVNLDSNNTIRILNGGKITLRDDSVADLATFKSRMASNNLVVYCDLATPIETPLTAEEVAAVRQLMTYKGTTIIESEMDVVSVTYSGDIKAYIDYRIDQIINPTALNEVAPMNLDETEG